MGVQAAQRAALKAEFPDAMLMVMPKSGHGLARDFKWLGSHRYGILHLGGRDEHELRDRTLQASALLGWPAPYADQLSAAPCPQQAHRTSIHLTGAPP